ncbi:hypothetical protein C8R48DRAFT_768906 [Suillus tomentosus]|nr:hypothetical protein C8R48DRAFT_768906 [Suillus tomentosus]
MAPRSWLSGEQQAFVLTYHESFLECKKNGNYTNFWPPFFEKWEEKWPIILEEEPVNEEMKLEEIAKARNALQTRLTVKLRNDFGNSKAGRRANTAGNTVVSKLIGDIAIKSGKKKSRPLNATEVYAKKYYASRVQPAVKEELDAMKDAPDAPEPKKRAMQVVRKQIASYWENESAEVKEEVAKLAEQMKEERVKDGKRDKELSKETIISRLTEIMSTFFTELHDATGWSFSVLLAGPDPMNGGKLDVSSLHIGTTTAGNRFNHAFPKFEENIMVPYFEFASRAFPSAAVLLSKGTTLPQDDTSSDTSPAMVPSTSPDTSLTLLDPLPSSMDTTSDTSPAMVPFASPDASLTLLDPLPSLSGLSGALLGQEADTSLAGLSSALLGQETSGPDTSLTHTPQPVYNFFRYSPPDPQDDSVDLDFNNTILPMPPNYKPPSPLPPSSPVLSSSPSSQTDCLPSLQLSPLTSTSQTGHNVSFSDAGEFRFGDPYDDTTLQTFTSPPRLRHLSSTLANTAHNQHRTSPLYNNTPTPMEIPAPAHTPTAVELPNSTQPSVVMPESESLTVGPILAAPAASGGTLLVTKKASKRKPTESNAENLEMAAVKRQKGGAVVVSTENSQHHVEGGRGKRQRFQSSRAATANAIGT